MKLKPIVSALALVALMNAELAPIEPGPKQCHICATPMNLPPVEYPHGAETGFSSGEYLFHSNNNSNSAAGTLAPNPGGNSFGA